MQPEVWGFARPDNAQVDAYGDLNLSIPVMTIPGRGIDFDVSFSYKSSIQVNQRASWIGLGWSFNPGSISREPEGAGTAATSITTSYGVDVFDDPTKPKALPDVYYVTIPGRGTVEMSQANDAGFSPNTTPTFSQGSFVVHEHTAWEIIADDDNVPDGVVTVGSCANTQDPTTCKNTTGSGTGTSFTTKNDFSEFVVTTEDGVRYVFGAPTLSYYDKHTSPSNTVLIREIYVNTWRLEAILGVNYSGNNIPDVTASPLPSGSWVVFDYGTTNDIETRAGTAPSLPANLSQTRYLRKIITPTHYADFGLANKVGPYYKDYETTGYQKRLTGIKLYRHGSSEVLEELVLDQGNDLGPDEESGSDCPSNVDCGKRLALRGIDFFSLGGSSGGLKSPGYIFEYVPGFTNPIDIASKCIDQFGFNARQNLNSQDRFGYNCSQPGDPSTDGRAWSLKKVTFPTGGSAEYVYETDNITNVSIPFYDAIDEVIEYYTIDSATFIERKTQGGARVVSITTSAAMGNPSEVVTYAYGSGRINGVPLEYWRKLVADEGGTRIFQPSNRGNIAVVYEWVERLQSDGSKVRTHYVTSAYEPQVGFFPAKLQTTVLVSNSTHFGICSGNEQWNWGKVYKTEFFENGNSTPVRTSDRSWNNLDTSTSTKMSKVWGHLSGQTSSDDDTFVYFAEDHHVSEDKTTDSPNGVSSSVEQKKLYSYDGQTNLVTGLKELSQAQYRHTETVYAHSLSGNIGMKNANMLSQRYSTMVCEGTLSSFSCSSAGTPDKSKNWTVWSDSDGFWRPRQEYAWLPDNTSDTSAPSSHTSSEAEELTTYDQYDVHGNLIKATDAHDTESSIRWTHDASVPKAIVENATSSEYFVEGFDEDLSAWTQYDVNGDGDTRWSIQNGKLELIHEGNSANYEFDRIFRDLGQTLTTGQVVVEFDLTIDDSNNNDLLIVLSTTGWVSSVWAVIKDETYRFYHPKTGGGYQWTTIKSGLQVGQTYQMKIVADVDAQTVDYYVDGVKLIDDGLFYQNPTGIRRVQFRNYGLGSVTTKWYIDNVRIYPADAQITSATYDDETLQMTSLVDANGTASYFEYDPLNRLTQVRDQQDRPVTNYNYYFSRDGVNNNDTFNSTDPNYMHSSEIQNPIVIADWSMELTENNNQSIAWQLDTARTTGTSSLDTTEAKMGVRSIKASVGANQRVLWDYWPAGYIPVDESKPYHIGIWAKTANGYTGDAFYKFYFDSTEITVSSDFQGVFYGRDTGIGERCPQYPKRVHERLRAP